MSAGSYCDYCPKDNKCSNSDLKKYCSCSPAECFGQDCAVKKCPANPTPPPTPEPKAAKFTITVEEITNALNHTHTGHPLENLVISKILALFAKEHITVTGGDITYAYVGDTVMVQNDSCKFHVQLDNGWTTQAVLKPATSVTLELGVGNQGRFHLPDLIVGGAFHLDSSFHVAANIHLGEGVKISGKCHEVSTENSRETIDGDLDIQANATLVLKPELVPGNVSTGWHLRFTPTVTVAGKLLSFDAKVYSALSVFGIDMKKIALLVDTTIDIGLKAEITDHLIQKELAALQVKLQHMADQIWPPGPSQGALPGITPDLITKMKAALKNIENTQKGYYP